MTEFDRQYYKILKNIIVNGYDFLSRDNHICRGLPGITMRQDLSEGFPILTLRKIPLKLFIAEMIWYISGSANPDDYVNKFTTIWKNFMTKEGNILPAHSYGYRWRKHFKRDQLKGIIELLKKSKGSRHAVVVTWDPSTDGLGQMGIPRLNIPCPYTFTVNILGNKLHLHNIIRSNDMVLGNPHDIAGFALLAYILSAKLNVKPGILTTSISNAHIWDTQMQQAKELLNRDFSNHNHPEIKFEAQNDYFQRAELADESLVPEIAQILKKQYNPMPKLKISKAVVGYNNK
jgi:thymidylate synthase